MSNPKTSSINAKITNLDEQVQWFYSDDFDLDQAEAKYKAATALAKDIEKDLEGLKNRIEVIDKDFSQA